MSELDLLYNAIREADQAGDATSVRVLAKELERQENVALAFKQELKADAVVNLTFANPYPEKTVVSPTTQPMPFGQSEVVTKIPLTDKSKKEWYTDFYKNNLMVILDTDEKGLDFDTGLSNVAKRMEPRMQAVSNPYLFTGVTAPREEMLSDRAMFGMMPTKDTKMAFLTQKFGKENVQYFSTPATDLFLWRENDKDPWKLPEPLETIELADITADLSAEIIPTTASIAGGVGGLAVGGPAGMAVGSGLGQAGGRFAQEYLLENTYLGEADVNRIAKKAAVEGVLTAAFDYGLTKGGKFLLGGWMGREGTDFFGQNIKDLALIPTDQPLIYKTPFLQQGGDVAQRVLRIENKFPNGPVANAIDEQRRIAAGTFEGTLAPNGSTAAKSEDALRNGIGHIAESLTSMRRKMLQRLDELKARRGEIETVNQSDATRQAKKEVSDAFDARIKTYEKDVLPTTTVSPAEGGNVAQQKIADAFVDVTIQKSRNFNDAYELLSGLNTPVNNLSRIFQKSSRELITDIEGDAIRILNANARNTAETAINKLDDLSSAGGTIDFKSVNEIIQKVEEKTRRGQFVAGFDANAYRQLADDLRSLRANMLENGDPQGVAQFEMANVFYRDEYLPYVGGEIESMIKPKIGQSYNEAIAAKGANEPFVLPAFNQKGDTVLGNILKNSGTADEYLKLSRAGMSERQILRDFWLQSKGLTAGRPININRIINMSEADMDMVRVLWPEGQKGSPAKGVAGWNDKVNTFRELKKLGEGKEQEIVNLSSETFNRIMNAGSKAEQEALRKIAREEVLINNRLNKQSSLMVKMANNGEIPLPENRVQMKTFLQGILRAKPEDQSKFINLLTDKDSSLVLDLQGALFHEMVRRTKVNGKLIDAASPKDNILWDPFEMSKELEKNSQLLNLLVGEEGYKNMVTSNNAIKSLTRPMKDETGKEMVPRVAATTSGPRLWLGNVAAPITDRIGAVVFGLQSKVPIKAVLNADTYDTVQNAMIKSLFLTSKGLQALNSESEDSPEFSKFLADNLAAIRDEQARLEEKAFVNPETGKPIK
jgi:hypothetical protein